LSRTLIAEEIEDLPTEKQRNVARAVFLEGKSTAEVANDLGIQPQAVRKHLRPARQRLIERLSD
jgi:RNA polymerase sigma factor (sigma-70 family)